MLGQASTRHLHLPPNPQNCDDKDSAVFEFCYKKYEVGECGRGSLKKEQKAHSN